MPTTQRTSRATRTTGTKQAIARDSEGFPEAKATDAPGERGGSQTLDRGLAVLEALALAPGSVAELSERLDLHRSIVTRLLRTLSQRAYVVRGEDNRYRPASKLLDLARSVEDPLRSTFRPILANLAEAARATAVLTITDEDEALCVEAVEPPHSHLHVAYRPGLRHPLDRAASGIAILAAMEPRENERPEVTKARHEGYATSQGELQTGAVGIAVPVFLPGRQEKGSVAVIGLAGSLSKEHVVPLIKEAVGSWIVPLGD